jgi:hypothetical protein
MLKVKDVLAMSVCFVVAAVLSAEGFFEFPSLLWCYLALHNAVVSPGFVTGLCRLRKVASFFAIAIKIEF